MNIRQNHHQAFTLVEILIAIAIIGILATIAVVSYPAMTVKSRVAKVATTAKKIQEGFELEAINGRKLPENNFCLNYNSSENCMKHPESSESINTNKQIIDELNQSFSIKESAKSNTFNSSDFVYLSKLTLVEIQEQAPGSYTETAAGERPALIYFIGDQTDCQNKSALWFTKNNQNGLIKAVANQPTQATSEHWSFQQYNTQAGQPGKKSINFCAIIINRPNTSYKTP